VLGRRAGGSPIRLSLFGGLDAGRTETIAAIAKLLTKLTQGLRMAQDYAVFGYPLVYPGGFAATSSSSCQFKDLAHRWKVDSMAPDAVFFRTEFQRTLPHGIITLRSHENSGFLFANVNSEVIGQEVVKPVLLNLRGLVRVQENPVKVFSTSQTNRRKQFLNGRLMPNPDTEPWPFEIELVVPAQLPFEVKLEALILATLDLLRGYRTFICHGGEL
jgi:hypothetical protein